MMRYPATNSRVISMTWRTLCAFQNMIKLTGDRWGRLCRMDI